MIEQNKHYVTNFSVLLVILQLALMIYVLGLDKLNLSDIYSLLLNYSVLLASVPIIFGLFILASKNLPDLINYTIKDTNGFLSSSPSNGNGKSHQNVDNINEGSIPVYLFVLGIVILLYNILLRILEPPFYLSFVLPLIFFLFVVKQFKASSLSF